MKYFKYSLIKVIVESISQWSKIILRIICNSFIPSIPSILLWWKEKISQIIDMKTEKYTQYKLSFVV